MRPWIIFLFFAFQPIAACKDAVQKSKASMQKANIPSPPIKDVDVPFKEYSIDALIGDTVFFEKSSILMFPPNSFTDKDGNIVSGKVQIKYREFTNPIDFYISGIPMDFDSAGLNYSFESSGMCEILAFKDGDPLFVNKNSKPEIHFLRSKPAEGQSLYYFDNSQQKWISKGGVTVTDISQKKTLPVMEETSLKEIDEIPLKPEKANKKNPIIRLIIDPESFKELKAYDNMQFEITGAGNKFNPADTSYEWSNVDLQKGLTKGLYSITFKNKEKSVTYSAKPVLEGEDYTKALEKFEKEEANYHKKLEQRLKIEEVNKVKYRLDSIENLQIIAENKKIEALNKLIDANNKIIEKNNNIVLSKNKSILIINSFLLDGFGTWNCDKASFINSPSIIAKFIDEKGKNIDLEHIAVIYKNYNGLMQFPDNKISFSANRAPMIIGIHNGRLGYVPYNILSSLNISPNTTTQTFPVTILSEKDNNYDHIKKIADLQ